MYEVCGDHKNGTNSNIDDNGRHDASQNTSNKMDTVKELWHLQNAYKLYKLYRSNPRLACEKMDCLLRHMEKLLQNYSGTDSSRFEAAYDQIKQLQTWQKYRLRLKRHQNKRKKARAQTTSFTKNAYNSVQRSDKESMMSFNTIRSRISSWASHFSSSGNKKYSTPISWRSQSIQNNSTHQRYSAIQNQRHHSFQPYPSEMSSRKHSTDHINYARIGYQDTRYYELPENVLEYNENFGVGKKNKGGKVDEIIEEGGSLTPDKNTSEEQKKAKRKPSKGSKSQSRSEERRASKEGMNDEKATMSDIRKVVLTNPTDDEIDTKKRRKNTEEKPNRKIDNTDTDINNEHPDRDNENGKKTRKEKQHRSESEEGQGHRPRDKEKRRKSSKRDENAEGVSEIRKRNEKRDKQDTPEPEKKTINTDGRRDRHDRSKSRDRERIEVERTKNCECDELDQKRNRSRTRYDSSEGGYDDRKNVNDTRRSRGRSRRRNHRSTSEDDGKDLELEEDRESDAEDLRVVRRERHASNKRYKQHASPKRRHGSSDEDDDYSRQASDRSRRAHYTCNCDCEPDRPTGHRSGKDHSRSRTDADLIDALSDVCSELSNRLHIEEDYEFRNKSRRGQVPCTSNRNRPYLSADTLNLLENSDMFGRNDMFGKHRMDYGQSFGLPPRAPRRQLAEMYESERPSFYGNMRPGPSNTTPAIMTPTPCPFFYPVPQPVSIPSVTVQSIPVQQPASLQPAPQVQQLSLPQQHQQQQQPQITVMPPQNMQSLPNPWYQNSPMTSPNQQNIMIRPSVTSMANPTQIPSHFPMYNPFQFPNTQNPMLQSNAMYPGGMATYGPRM